MKIVIWLLRCSWLECRRNFDSWRPCWHCGLTRDETPPSRWQAWREARRLSKSLPKAKVLP